MRNVPARRRADHPGLVARPAKLIGNFHYNFASSLEPGRSAGVDSPGNEFIAALTLTTSNSAIPLTVRLDSFIGQYTVDWQHLFGASLVATIPVLILFALIERRVVGGLTAGSIR